MTTNLAPYLSSVSSSILRPISVRALPILFTWIIIVFAWSQGAFAQTTPVSIEESGENAWQNGELLLLPNSIDQVCGFLAQNDAANLLFADAGGTAPREIRTHFERLSDILFPTSGYSASNISPTDQYMFALRRLCADKVYDNGFAVRQGFPLWKNDTCPETYRLPDITIQAIRSLLSSRKIRGVEIGCARFGNLQLRDVDFDFFVVKSSDIFRINIQNSRLGSLDLHNSEVDHLTIQGTEIHRRMIVSRSNFDTVTIFASPISDIQLYDFYRTNGVGRKLSDRHVNEINRMRVFNSNIDNFRTYLTNFGSLDIDDSHLSTVNLFPSIRDDLSLTNSIVETSLAIATESGDAPQWNENAVFDLSGTHARAFLATPKSFTIDGSQKLVPTNFNGFTFTQAARRIPVDGSGGIEKHIVHLPAVELSQWVEQSGIVLNVDSGRDFIYQVASYLRKIGSNDAANALAATEKSKEWFDRNILVWIVGKITGFGYQNSNLWYLLVFLPVGVFIKARSRLRERSGDLPRFSMNQLLQDVIFSIDRFLSPLIIQKNWDNYPDLNAHEKTYFYVHRIAGSIALLLGAFSLVGEF